MSEPMREPYWRTYHVETPLDKFVEESGRVIICRGLVVPVRDFKIGLNDYVIEHELEMKGVFDCVQGSMLRYGITTRRISLDGVDEDFFVDIGVVLPHLKSIRFKKLNRILDKTWARQLTHSLLFTSGYYEHPKEEGPMIKCIECLKALFLEDEPHGVYEDGREGTDPLKFWHVASFCIDSAAHLL